VEHEACLGFLPPPSVHFGNCSASQVAQRGTKFTQIKHPTWIKKVIQLEAGFDWMRLDDLKN
jgi:hypothetical protein